MTAKRFINEGVTHLTAAVAADQSREYDRALQLYILGIHNLLLAIKYNLTTRVKTMIRAKVTEFLPRAESIKEYLELQKAMALSTAPSPSPSSSLSTSTSSSLSSSTSKFTLRGDANAAIRKELESTAITPDNRISWDDVAGMRDVKQALEEAVMLPKKFPQMFTGERKPWQGILLYGPPGTGKTHIAKAVASVSNSSFYAVSASDLVSKYLGESEKKIRELFKMAVEAKPSIIFFDEIDALCSTRNESSSGNSETSNRMKTEFLACMQDILDHSGVLVLAATNRPFDLDSAVRRRFQKRIYVPLPDAPTRHKLIELHLGEENSELTQRDIQTIVQKTEGYSGSDVAVACRDTLMQPVRELMAAKYWRPVAFNDAGEPQYAPCSPHNADAQACNLMDLSPDSIVLPPITAEHFDAALKHCKSSVNAKELGLFDEFTRLHGTTPHLADADDEEELIPAQPMMEAAPTILIDLSNQDDEEEKENEDMQISEKLPEMKRAKRVQPKRAAKQRKPKREAA